MYLNKAQVIGRVTKDPELKTTPGGLNIANFSIATNRVYNDRDGKRQEEVEFHNIVAFGKDAENLKTYVTKGQILYVEGRLQTQSWEKDGVKHYRTEIICEKFQFGPKTGQAAANNGAGGSTGTKDDEDPGQINPEDIPF